MADETLKQSIGLYKCTYGDMTKKVVAAELKSPCTCTRPMCRDFLFLDIQFSLTGLFCNVNGIVTEPPNDLEIKLTETVCIYLHVCRMRADGYLRPDIDA